MILKVPWTPIDINMTLSVAQKHRLLAGSVWAWCLVCFAGQNKWSDQGQAGLLLLLRYLGPSWLPLGLSQPLMMDGNGLENTLLMPQTLCIIASPVN